MNSTRARIRAIADAVCVEYGVTMQALRGESMITQVVEPRQVAVHLCKKLAGAAFCDIGRYVANYTDSSASCAYRKIMRRAARDPSLAERLAKIESAVGD